MEIFLLLLLGWACFCLYKTVCSHFCSKCGAWGTLWKQEEHLSACKYCDYEEDTNIYRGMSAKVTALWPKK